jgi:hypothetical protein
MSKNRLEAFGDGAALLRGFIGVLPDLNAQDQDTLATGGMVAARMSWSWLRTKATGSASRPRVAGCTATGSMSAGQRLVGG